MVIDLSGDTVGHDEMQENNAVATINGLQFKLPVVFSRGVVFEAESVAVVDARLALPATAVVEGDVIAWPCREVKQQAILTFRVVGVVDHSYQYGVVVD